MSIRNWITARLHAIGDGFDRYFAPWAADVQRAGAHRAEIKRIQAEQDESYAQAMARMTGADPVAFEPDPGDADVLTALQAGDDEVAGWPIGMRAAGLTPDQAVSLNEHAAREAAAELEDQAAAEREQPAVYGVARTPADPPAETSMTTTDPWAEPEPGRAEAEAALQAGEEEFADYWSGEGQDARRGEQEEDEWRMEWAWDRGQYHVFARRTFEGDYGEEFTRDYAAVSDDGTTWTALAGGQPIGTAVGEKAAIDICEAYDAALPDPVIPDPDAEQDAAREAGQIAEEAAGDGPEADAWPDNDYAAEDAYEGDHQYAAQINAKADELRRAQRLAVYAEKEYGRKSTEAVKADMALNDVTFSASSAALHAYAQMANAESADAEAEKLDAAREASERVWALTGDPGSVRPLPADVQASADRIRDMTPDERMANIEAAVAEHENEAGQGFMGAPVPEDAGREPGVASSWDEPLPPSVVASLDQGYAAKRDGAQNWDGRICADMTGSWIESPAAAREADREADAEIEAGQ